MKNVFVRRILSEGLVQLALSNSWGVTAVRLTWPRDPHINSTVWSSISEIRDGLDELLRGFPGWVLFVSAITGSLGPQRLIRPAVNHWVVTRGGTADCRAVLQHMQANQAGAVPKLLIQPYQRTEKDIAGVLYTLVKDNIGGCVPRMVAASDKRRGGLVSTTGATDWEPIVRIYLKDSALQVALEALAGQLNDARFPVQLMLPH